MSQYKSLLTHIGNLKLNFVNNVLKLTIGNVINNFFPNLNQQDIIIINILTIFIIDLISNKYGFTQEKEYYKQWEQNNGRDIKGIILLLLPFIDDKYNGYLLNKITDLNQLLYAYPENKIPNHISMITRELVLPTNFEFGNMMIGLIYENMDVNLYEDNDKLIYKIMFNNMIGLLQTLEIINGKTYINWINTVPLNLLNYKQSYIYRKTNETLKQLNSNNITTILRTSLTNYYGLWFGDMYNILRIKYYEEAKPIKWLIFPYEFYANNKLNKIYLIQGLNNMIDLDIIINSDVNSYNDLDDNNKHIFKTKLNDIYINMLANANITGLMKVDNMIILYMLISLINNYQPIANIEDNDVINKFKLDNNNEEQDDYSKSDNMKIQNITRKDIIECLNIFRLEYIHYLWNFLKEYLNLFMVSSYGKFLITNNTINNYYYYNNESNLNLKNIYNIAKSLSHTVINNTWVLLDKNYISFNESNKIMFFDRIYNWSDTKWINITSNLKRQYIDINFDANEKLNEILTTFRNIYVDLIFEELVTSGILNKFEVNLEITDKTIGSSNFKVRKDLIKELLAKKFTDNKKDYDESYYYITGKKFSELDTIKVEKKIALANNKYDVMTYFELIAKDQEWPTFYAMDWISQISFFHHYIYHQVLYVTGATGQGKSTQVPKLLLYALKMIDYKSQGKVICTQPRITPTVGNATRIAEELGVPIEQPSNNSSLKMKTNNNYVQFKHSDESYTTNNMKQGFLRIVTDGTLLEELLLNPTLKHHVNDKIIDNNIYDIVIVDEAHEHNINMDIIITLTKQACYYNNMVKLVIVSATMDDDEPIYRQYFKYINDNLLFPIKSLMNIQLHNININSYLPNSIYMDRRYHISPPGETTQYRVDEIYLDENPSNSKMAQEFGYNKILEICNKSITGDILFFANGVKEIKEATKFLNTYLPDGVIALPFYSELNENYKNIVTKIDSKIYSIKNKRANINDEWGANFIEDMSVPNGIYKRAVIIATNVAEASITLNSLKYVVDNGYAKVNIFNPSIGLSALVVEEISEASRIQRKGRVGRVGDGTVYYMYKKDAKKYIKPKYKITQEDVSTVILKLLCFKNLNEMNIMDHMNISRLIVSDEINPNSFDFFKKLDNTDINIDTYTFKSGLFDLYKKNYRINNMNLTEDYYLHMPSKLLDIYYAFNTGQIIMNVLDTRGRFYLIHPFENSIKRNIMNTIIQYENIKIDKISNIKYRHILAYLFDKNLLLDMNANKLFNNTYDIIYEERNFMVSELATKFRILSRDFGTTIPESIVLISASAMNCFNEVIMLIIFMKLLPFNSITKIIKDTIKWPEFKKIYGGADVKSDLIFIHNIIQKIHKQFSNMLVFNLNSPNFNSKLILKINAIIERFRIQSKDKNYDPYNIDIKLWNKLLQLKKNGKLNNDVIKIIKNDAITFKMISDDININKADIITWCDNNHINSHLILSYMESYAKYYLKKNITESNEVILWAKQFPNFNKFLTTNTMEEKIIRSFIYGYPNQYTYSINNKNKFVTYINKKLCPVKFAEAYFKGESETLTSLSNNMTFYLNYSKVEDPDIIGNELLDILNVKILSQIEAEWLIPALPLFMNPLCTPDIVMNIGLNDNISTVNYSNSSGIEMFKREIINKWNKHYVVWDNINVPILQYFYKNINKSISKYLKY